MRPAPEWLETFNRLAADDAAREFRRFGIPRERLSSGVLFRDLRAPRAGAVAVRPECERIDTTLTGGR